MEKHSWRTEPYLKEVGAVLTHSEIKIWFIHFDTCLARVNHVDYYTKRNGKTCYVTDWKMERNIKIPKEWVEEKEVLMKSYIDDFYVSERGESIGYGIKRFVSDENKAKIIEQYKTMMNGK